MTVNKGKQLAYAACAGLLLSSASASAQSIQLDLNNGRIGVGPTEEQRVPRERFDDRRGSRVIEEEGARVSCRDGRRIVSSSGFRDVRPLDCGSRTLVYTARERGAPVEVTVSARSGQIVSVQPL